MKLSGVILITVAGAALLAASWTRLSTAEYVSKKKPRDIHDVMEWSHKGKASMAAKVRDGKGAPNEVNTLLRSNKFVAMQKPLQGDEARGRASDLLFRKPRPLHLVPLRAILARGDSHSKRLGFRGAGQPHLRRQRRSLIAYDSPAPPRPKFSKPVVALVATREDPRDPGTRFVTGGCRPSLAAV